MLWAMEEIYLASGQVLVTTLKNAVDGAHVSLKCQIKKSQSPFPRHMAHRAAPISVSIALGHASANAVRATAGAGPLVAPRV